MIKYTMISLADSIVGQTQFNNQNTVNGTTIFLKARNII
ncbi:MAG: hypothetical protein ACI88H_003180 [Cocleimonas sp.]|jgi:hypothetical protein